MGRLTYWNEKKQHFDWRCENNEVADKLAAYEDTGMAPEDFLALYDAYGEMITRTYGPFSQSIAKWLEANREGRLVVLPCKIGDKVYKIQYNTGSCYTCADYHPYYPDVDIPSECDKHFCLYPDLYATPKDPICPKHFMEIVKTSFDFVYRGRVGKSVFLTREEAEKALEGMR